MNELEATADQSSNAGRESAINNLQAAMVEEILSMEDRVGEVHTIRQHGKDTPDRADRINRNTYPMEAKIFKREYKTGGVSHKPALNRLARMQAIYGVCSRISNEAIGMHERALPAYMERVQEFANIMQAEIDATEQMLPVEKDVEEKSQG